MHQDEKVALVTGAGSGIGRGCALALLAAGWRVVLTGRRSDALESARAVAGLAGDRAGRRTCSRDLHWPATPIPPKRWIGAFV